MCLCSWYRRASPTCCSHWILLLTGATKSSTGRNTTRTLAWHSATQASKPRRAIPRCLATTPLPTGHLTGSTPSPLLMPRRPSRFVALGLNMPFRWISYPPLKDILSPDFDGNEWHIAYQHLVNDEAGSWFSCLRRIGTPPNGREAACSAASRTAWTCRPMSMRLC
ncbi:hypothetical protein PF008_g11028 [Phytophthora fragariae]|uniref:Uncharacterized protein n=1 Tax=Phytophthora fragariae TaxID=53985 RepID=A0A6G0RTG5_9STRA|nr:hypothetical protein PF008_g11028 [Phytophthora fragariae]